MNLRRSLLIPKPQDKTCKLASHFELGHTKKLTYYDCESLLRLRALFYVVGVAFADRVVVQNILILVAISSLCCSLVVVGVEQVKLNVDNLNAARPFLKIFITFMLGIYVNRAFIRWWSIITSFQKFMANIKQLIYFFHASRIDDETISTARRWAVASAYSLDTEAKNAQQMDLQHDWYTKTTLEWLVQNNYLTVEEQEELEYLVLIQTEKAEPMETQQGQVTGTIGVASQPIWNWIGDLLMDMRGMMSPPMHSRVMGICQSTLGQIDDLKLQVTLQVPYMYAHLLSFLVHLNNTITAVATGISFGMSCSELVWHQNQTPSSKSSSTESTQGKIVAAENMAMQIMMLMVEPLLYMSFLRIGHLLCYPFGYQSHHVSVETNIAWLQAELEVMSTSFNFSRKRKGNSVKNPRITKSATNSETSGQEAPGDMDLGMAESGLVLMEDMQGDTAMDM